MLNAEVGRIDPKTLGFRLEGKISIDSGPFAGTLVRCSEGGDGEEHEPSCHMSSINVPATAANCGEYFGAIHQSGPICGDGICNYSDEFSIFVQHGGKSLWIGPKECSDALNGMNISGDWYVLISAPGALCSSFPRSSGVRVFYAF